MESACPCVETAGGSDNLQHTITVSCLLTTAKPVLTCTRVCGATIAQLVTLRPYFKSPDQTCLLLPPPENMLLLIISFRVERQPQHLQRVRSPVPYF